MPVMILFLPLFLHFLLLLSSSTSESKCVSVVTASHVRTPKADMTTGFIYHSYDKRYTSSNNCQLLNFCGGLVAEKVSSVPSVQASLRMPVKATTKERKARVDQAILEMGLVSCLDPKIGCKHEKSISCGEKKRLSFACEILTDPPILFCDEPTSGLDSFMALQVMKALSTLAREGKTVVWSIHQPSSQVFEMADKLVLLVLGQIAYKGPIKEVDAFFRNCNMPVPKYISIPDHFMKVLSRNAHSESEEEYMTRTKRVFSNYKSCGYSDAVHNETHHLETSSTGTRTRLVGNNRNYAAPWHSQFFWLFWRGLKVVLREPMIVRVRLVQCALVSIAFGTHDFRLSIIFLLLLHLPQTSAIQCMIGYADNLTSSLVEVSFLAPVGCSVEFSRYNISFVASHVYFEECTKTGKISICSCDTNKCTTNSSFLEKLPVSRKVTRVARKLIEKLAKESKPFSDEILGYVIGVPVGVSFLITLVLDIGLVCCCTNPKAERTLCRLVLEFPIIASVTCGLASIFLFGLLCAVKEYLRYSLTLSAFSFLTASVLCLLFMHFRSSDYDKIQKKGKYCLVWALTIVILLCTAVGCCLCAVSAFNGFMGDLGNLVNAIAATCGAVVAYITVVSVMRQTMRNKEMMKRRSTIISLVAVDDAATNNFELGPKSIVDQSSSGNPAPSASGIVHPVHVPPSQPSPFVSRTVDRRVSAPARLPMI